MKYGCTIDMPEGHGDECVLDEGNPNDCLYSQRHGSKAREHCGCWKPVLIYQGKYVPQVAAPTLPVDAVVDALAVIRAWSQPYSDKRAEVEEAWRTVDAALIRKEAT